MKRMCPRALPLLPAAATLFPPQGFWSEEDYLALPTNQALPGKRAPASRRRSQRKPCKEAGSLFYPALHDPCSAQALLAVVEDRELARRHSLVRLGELRRPIWLRFVLVPGWTDDPGDIAKIAEFCAELGTVERVDVLPFHQMGKYKWERLKMEYALRDLEPPTNEAVERACAAFRACGLKAY